MNDMDFLWGISMGFVFGALISGGMVSSGWHTATVNRGLAIYCPWDGDWAWVGECAEGEVQP